MTDKIANVQLYLNCIINCNCIYFSKIKISNSFSDRSISDTYICEIFFLFKLSSECFDFIQVQIIFSICFLVADGSCHFLFQSLHLTYCEKLLTIFFPGFVCVKALNLGIKEFNLSLRKWKYLYQCGLRLFWNFFLQKMHISNVNPFIVKIFEN